ncbi:JAB domain-containing protein [Sphingomonas sp. ASV193]|uniref:JAB domain-containing protein n=1 Tax=Sphingomonas sp. ASV193 TaxID=3144405 RepID=UPI0032E88CDD
MAFQRAESPARLDGYDAAVAFFQGCFPDRRAGTESLFVAHLDQQARCLHLSRHVGEAGSVDLPVRTIIGDAARFDSAGVIVAHNHPSGDARPSADDQRATRRLAVAAESIDLAVVDHLVFGAADVSSFRRMGLL